MSFGHPEENALRISIMQLTQLLAKTTNHLFKPPLFSSSSCFWCLHLTCYYQCHAKKKGKKNKLANQRGYMLAMCLLWHINSLIGRIILRFGTFFGMDQH